MLNKSAVAIAALALAGEFAAASLTGSDAFAKDRHTRMLKKRGALNGTAENGPCKRGDNAGNQAAGNFNSVKIIAAGGASNLTVFTAESRKPLTESSSSSSQSSSQWSSSSEDTRQALPDSSSSEQQWSSSSSSDNSWSSQEPSSSAWSSSPAPSATVQGAAGTSAPSSGGMNVVTSWTGSDFNNWDFFTWSDPTHGTVQYVSQAVAQASNLIGVQNGQYKMSVDTGSLLSSGLRQSVRISSPSNWKKGQLVVADIAHMPEGCGTWPAFWSIGASRAWPAGGEIDILEGVNNVAGNTYTLHTTSGCTVTKNQASSSLFLTGDCQYQPGCSYKDQVDNSFGPTFNTAGGGVYAAFYDDSGIKIWFWSAGSVPSSLASGSPDMSTFGTPKATFGSDNCSMDTFFDDEQMLIINTTLMGDWAGATYAQNGCTVPQSSLVAQGSNFSNAYWLINSVKIYQ